MSIKTYQVMTPVADVQAAPMAYGVLRGGSQVSVVPSAATSVSNSGIVFNSPPPSAGTIVDRQMFIRAILHFQVNTTAVPGQFPVQVGLNDGLRAYPLSSCISSANLTINSASISASVNDIVHPMSRYYNGDETRRGVLSTSPSMPDQLQAYEQWSTYGSARNPLAMYAENSAEMSRGAFPMTIVQALGGTAAVITVEVCEPIYVSPLSWGVRQEQGLVGVTTFQLNLTLANLTTRLWSRAGGLPGGAGTVSLVTGQTSFFVGNPLLLCKYITPLASMPIPREQVIPYFDNSRYITAGPSLAPGASNTITTTSIQLSSIPNRIYLFMRETDSTRTLQSCDTYAYISNVSVQWGNASGLLSSASPQDLYQLSVRNGCNLSWPQWAHHVGSVLCLSFPADIGLDEISAPGKLGQYTLQVRMSYTNLAPVARIFDAYVLAITEGVLVNSNGSSMTRIGVLSPAEIVAAIPHGAAPAMSYHHIQTLYGGSWFSSIGNFFKDLGNSVVSGAKKIVPVLSDGLKIAKKLHLPGQIGTAIDVADSGLDTVRDFTGLGRPRKAGRKVKGAITQAQLRAMMG